MFILKIKYYRRKRRLTQKKLAEKANVTQSYISALERAGRTKSPTLYTLTHIAFALGICPFDLVECTHNCLHCKYRKP